MVLGSSTSDLVVAIVVIVISGTFAGCCLLLLFTFLARYVCLSCVVGGFHSAALFAQLVVPVVIDAVIILLWIYHVTFF